MCLGGLNPSFEENCGSRWKIHGNSLSAKRLTGERPLDEGREGAEGQLAKTTIYWLPDDGLGLRACARWKAPFNTYWSVYKAQPLPPIALEQTPFPQTYHQNPSLNSSDRFRSCQTTVKFKQRVFFDWPDHKSGVTVTGYGLILLHFNEIVGHGRPLHIQFTHKRLEIDERSKCKTLDWEGCEFSPLIWAADLGFADMFRRVSV